MIKLALARQKSYNSLKLTMHHITFDKNIPHSFLKQTEECSVVIAGWGRTQTICKRPPEYLMWLNKLVTSRGIEYSTSSVNIPVRTVKKTLLYLFCLWITLCNLQWVYNLCSFLKKYSINKSYTALKHSLYSYGN